MKYTQFGVSIILCLFLSEIKAQCGNPFLLQTNNIDAIAQQELIVKNTIDNLLHHQTARIVADNDTIRIPVVFNILYADSIADAKLLNKAVFYEVLDSANKYFNISLNYILNSNRAEYHDIVAIPYIQLIVARIDPNGNKTDGFRYKKWNVPNGSEFCEFPWLTGQRKAKLDQYGGITAWNNLEYLNFWVGNFGKGTICFSGQSTYPTFPFLQGQPLNFMDGILLQDYLFKGTHTRMAYFSTVLHEVGHYLGLLHTWGGIFDEQQVGCNIDDNIKDTPLQYDASYNCNSIRNTCIEVNNDKNDMCTNVMDYADGITFTKEQVAVMRNAALVIRKKLPIIKTAATLEVSSNRICKGDSVTVRWIKDVNQAAELLFPSWNLTSQNLSYTFYPQNDTTLELFLTNTYDTIYEIISISVVNETPQLINNLQNSIINNNDTLQLFFEHTDTVLTTISSTYNNNILTFIATDGTDSFWVYFNNLCYEDSFFVTYAINNTATFTNQKSYKQLTIYPNPATNYINHNADILLDDYAYFILDKTGKIVQQDRDKQQIDISLLPFGTYFLMIKTSKERYIGKFIKK